MTTASSSSLVPRYRHVRDNKPYTGMLEATLQAQTVRHQDVCAGLGCVVLCMGVEWTGSLVFGLYFCVSNV